MNVTRVVLIVLLILSLFITAKSFVAADNIEQWSEDIRVMFFMELGKVGQRSYAIESYMSRIEDIQKQWSIMRPVSIASAALCLFGIFWVSWRDRRVHSIVISDSDL